MKLSYKNLSRIKTATERYKLINTKEEIVFPQLQEGKQALFGKIDADVIFYGGAAGAGKTRALLTDFVRQEYIDNPDYRAVMFRRTYPEFTQAGGLVDESRKIYYPIKGTFIEKPGLEWRFPSGARVSFRHLQHEKTVHIYQGSQIARIGFDELTHFCLTPDHEVLTESGWKFISDVFDGELVASCSLDRSIEYKKASPVSFDYEGEMLGIKNDCITTLMTPNHRVMVEKQLPNELKTPGNIFSGWRFKDASDVYGKTIYIPRVGKHIGEEVDYCYLSGVDGRGIGSNANTVERVKMDDWLVFLGWYFSEGSSFETVNKNAVIGRGSPITSIRQTKEENKPEIRKMLDKTGFKWSETKDGQFKIFSRQLYENLKEFGKGAKEKHIPRWLFKLSVRQIKLFLDAFVKGDGYVNPSGAIQIGLCNKGLIDDLQELYFLCGFPAYSSHFVTKSGFDVYSLYVISCNRSNTSVCVRKSNWFKENYKGKVHCLLVEDNHNFLVRHNGHIFWTGNSLDQFFYLLSRNRSVSGIKPAVRATCNPDADSWVADFISWWINPKDGYAIEERSGIVRYFIRQGDAIYWADDKQELIDKFSLKDKLFEMIPSDIQKKFLLDEEISIKPEDLVKSFTFIPATIFDNKELIKVNPTYLANLYSLHQVERERLLRGNWKIKYEAGTVFDRTWFEILDKIPDNWKLIGKVRFWDLAATAKENAENYHCYTSGTLVYKYQRIKNTLPDSTEIKEFAYVIADNICEQKKVGEVELMLKNTAELDGKTVAVRWEQEGGSSGKFVENTITNVIRENHPNHDIKAIAPQGDKLTRALPVATAASRGQIFILRDGTWNTRFLNACQGFDGSKKTPPTNDIVDSLSGAFYSLENEFQGHEDVISTIVNTIPVNRFRSGFKG